MTDRPTEPSAAAARRGRSDIRFAHASEAEFAHILDFYDVRWLYEPEVFPILWDLDGNVLESFTPDFYLPDFEMFVEMTTLQQHLVRKKNRKVRRLRELYPFINIKLFYARDFRALMLKYGRMALVDELSGAVGQVSAQSAPSTHVMSPSVAAGPRPAAVTATEIAIEAATEAATVMASGAAPGDAPRAGRSRAARRRAARRAAVATHHSVDPR